ncbi:MAG TPA: zinc ribbon domain-containing protein [Pyrinomonadaceae bacterium]|nr:zinc ribbon domain-containing protein [Pyrinomonadaceae bacterium]
MYCSSCGGAVAPGRSYCNHCGTKLGGAKDDAAPRESTTLSESLIWAIVGVFVVGMGTTIGLMAMLKQLVDLSQSLILLFGLLSFALMIAVESVFIYMLLSRRRSAKKVGPPDEHTEGRATKELDAAREVPALPEPVPSVTEQPTRTFEPVYSERAKKG